MAQKEFQAESKRLLDLMVNSIYTHKEIFLRELISNASDAIDKLYFKSTTEGPTGLDRSDFFIRVAPDREKRTLTITDNGIGMTGKELEENLGTIAKSGSLKFKRENPNGDDSADIDIIGQFGVGFYSAFMVSDSVTVESRAFGQDKACRWTSSGSEGYDIEECGYPNRGTTVTLALKPDTEDEAYSQYLEPYTLRSLIKRYSDYIRYPIRLEMPRSRKKEGTEDEYEEYFEDEVINSMIPIWKKSRSETTDEEITEFYKDKFSDWQEPLKVIRSSTEGAATYTAMLFIPRTAPYNYYSRDYEKGLQLYASGVLIMDKCPDLLPDCFGFVRGLVDSQDLSLNISREMLQHDRQLKLIASRLEKKIASELKSMLENDREKYEEFWKSFGLQIKYGMYESFGQKAEELRDLALFTSSYEKKPVTLKEYVDRMAPGQEHIYYGCGQTPERILSLPQAGALMKKGYELLCLTDDVDEFALKMLVKYDDKEFKNVAAEGLDLGSDEDKERIKDLSTEHKDLLEAMAKALEGKVQEVKLTCGLMGHPAALSTQGELSAEMEKVLNTMPTGEKVHAKRVLELDPEHPVFDKLLDAGEERLGLYAGVHYGQALLLEGTPLEDPSEFARQLAMLIS